MLLHEGDTFTADLFSSHSGIYAIINAKTKIAYIGQSLDILTRWRIHYLKLQSGRHSNKSLLDDWRSLGPYGFEFTVLELCEANKLNERERYWIQEWKPSTYNNTVPSGPNYIVSAKERSSTPRWIWKMWKRYYSKYPEQGISGFLKYVTKHRNDIDAVSLSREPVSVIVAMLGL